MTGPRRNTALDPSPLSAFEPIVDRLARVARERHVIPLHQGKTAFTTPVGLREWRPGEFDEPAHHDGPSAGAPSLVSAIVDKVEASIGDGVDPGRIQVTMGITHALATAFHAILAPGDEVALLSPQWLFASGLVRAAHGVPVEVPWFTSTAVMAGDLVDQVAAQTCDRTRAIYLNTPNNPTGRSLTAQQLNALLEFAARRGLWVIADNAYEYYDYTPDGFVDPVSLPLGRDRVFAAYSFSKSFGMTGYRVGYLLSPPRMAEAARKFALYSVYSAPTCSQFAALAALRSVPGVLDEHRRFVKTALELTVDKLAVPARRPDGGFYLLLDLSGWAPGAEDFIARCVDQGVSLAPGSAFGGHCGGYARLCYSVVDHEDLVQGIEIINSVYAVGR